MPDLRLDLRDEPAHRRTRGEQTLEVEVGLVEPDDLDPLDVRADDRHHPPRDLPVGGEVRGMKIACGHSRRAREAGIAEPTPNGGPRSSRWSRPRGSRARDHDRQAAQLGTAVQLDRDVEGVGVEVGDPQLARPEAEASTARIYRRSRPSRTPAALSRGCAPWRAGPALGFGGAERRGARSSRAMRRRACGRCGARGCARSRRDVEVGSDLGVRAALVQAHEHVGLAGVSRPEPGRRRNPRGMSCIPREARWIALSTSRAWVAFARQAAAPKASSCEHSTPRARGRAAADACRGDAWSGRGRRGGAQRRCVEDHDPWIARAQYGRELWRGDVVRDELERRSSSIRPAGRARAGRRTVRARRGSMSCPACRDPIGSRRQTGEDCITRSVTPRLTRRSPVKDDLSGACYRETD